MLQRQFDELTFEIIRTAASSPGSGPIESAMQELLNLMADRAESREYYATRLLDLIHDPAPGELILGQPGIVEMLEYTMHVLRWPEIQQSLLLLDSDGTDLRVRRSAQRVLDSYRDDWPNADIYAKYRT